MSGQQAGPGMEEIQRRSKQVDRLFEEPNARFLPLSDQLLERLREKQADDPEVIPTPWPSLNRASRDEGGGQGVALGWYVVLAGSTGAGKTLAGLNLVAEALKRGHNVLFFSLEMGWEQLATRLRAIVTGEDVTRLEWGGKYDPEKAREADELLTGLPGKLFVNVEPIWELGDIREVMDVHRDTDDVELVVVDYAQLVHPSGSDRELYQAMSEISSQLRYMARKLRVVTVALSQLNRSTTRDRDRKPTVDGLFGSSRFGFDADQVLALDFSRREKDEVNRVERTWLNLVKNRHGPSIEIPVAIEKKSLRIREALADEESAWPGVHP